MAITWLCGKLGTCYIGKMDFLSRIYACHDFGNMNYGLIPSQSGDKSLGRPGEETLRAPGTGMGLSAGEL